jgi:hypothetical protein
MAEQIRLRKQWLEKQRMEKEAERERHRVEEARKRQQARDDAEEKRKWKERECEEEKRRAEFKRAEREQEAKIAKEKNKANEQIEREKKIAEKKMQQQEDDEEEEKMKQRREDDMIAREQDKEAAEQMRLESLRRRKIDADARIKKWKLELEEGRRKRQQDAAAHQKRLEKAEDEHRELLKDIERKHELEKEQKLLKIKQEDDEYELEAEIQKVADQARLRRLEDNRAVQMKLMDMKREKQKEAIRQIAQGTNQARLLEDARQEQRNKLLLEDAGKDDVRHMERDKFMKSYEEARMNEVKEDFERKRLARERMERDERRNQQFEMEQANLAMTAGELRRKQEEERYQRENEEVGPQRCV